MSEDDLRWVAAQFRTFREAGAAGPRWPAIEVSSWWREPDYSDDYRHLHDLERELSTIAASRWTYELLSVWRAARDPEYPRWAFAMGTRVCQITFFGMEATNDWFHRRRGAFPDALAATERLLEAGIRPRWQLIFTKRLLSGLASLLALADGMHLRERCEALGGPFVIFLNCPSPDGNAFEMEHLRPTVRDLDRVPAWLREASEAHLGRALGETERALMARLGADDAPVGGVPPRLWFEVTPDLDVYTNVAAPLLWFRLGNLRQDGVARVVEAFENDHTIGLQAQYHVPLSELARRFGRPRGQRIYSEGDLKARWVRCYCEEAASGARDDLRPTP